MKACGKYGGIRPKHNSFYVYASGSDGGGDVGSHLQGAPRNDLRSQTAAMFQALFDALKGELFQMAARLAQANAARRTLPTWNVLPTK